MRFLAFVTIFATVCSHGVLCEPNDNSFLLTKRYTGGTVSKATAVVKERGKPIVRRQISFVNGGLQIGGLTLGGNGGKGEGAATNTTGESGLNIGGLTLGGEKTEGTKEAESNNGQSLESFLSAAQAAAKNSSGAAEVATPVENTEGSNNTEATAEAGEVVAVTESEQFSENAGITIGANGQVQNLGGNLGITQGSDGSVSVGGENGINVTPSAAAEGNQAEAASNAGEE